MSERPNASVPYTESTICGQPCTPVARKVTSTGKFQTASWESASRSEPPEVDICVIPSSTPRATCQSSPEENV